MQGFVGAAAHLLFDDGAPDIQQTAVVHARRTGGFARTAGEAAIQMQLRFRRGLHAFKHLLDEINAPTRAVEFIAEQLVSRASRRAKTAVHTLAQNAFGLRTLGRVFDKVGELRFHVTI